MKGRGEGVGGGMDGRSEGVGGGWREGVRELVGDGEKE